MKYLSGVIAALAMISLSACPSWAKLDVVASFSILGDMVEQVAGDKATVTTIVGPDADAHLYAPT
ncbi:MAG: zinc ABC transporter substrate-binding protein, partial [Pseudomonadota bacterium]|nr:zinc ABC transporter substrate-binding protein [Pseudomonadota bacterium]